MEWNDRSGLNRSWAEGSTRVPELPRWLKPGPESSLDIPIRPETLTLSQYGLAPDMASNFPHLASTVYSSDASLYGGLGHKDAGGYLLHNPELAGATAAAVSAPYFSSSALATGISGVSGFSTSGSHLLGINNPLLATHSNGLLPSDDYLASSGSLLRPHQFAPLERREEPLTKLGDYGSLTKLGDYGSSASTKLGDYGSLASTKLGDYGSFKSLASPLLKHERDRDRYADLLPRSGLSRDRYADLLPRSGLSRRSLSPLRRRHYSPRRQRSLASRGRSPLSRSPRGRSPRRGHSPRQLGKSLKRKSRSGPEGKDANAVADKSKRVETNNQGRNKNAETKKQDKSKEIEVTKQEKIKEIEGKKEDKSMKIAVKKQVGIDGKKEDKSKEVESKKPDAASTPNEATKSTAIDKLTVENPIAGMIFGCNHATEQECRRLQLFGLPATRTNDVSRVVPGTKLFLFNFDSKELSGVFEAASRGAIDIVPHAFKSYGSFPAQVRTRRVMKVPNLPLKVFKEAIKENFYSLVRFNYELNASQVEKLVALFTSTNVKAIA